ncbi:MAG: type II toxin-antitoxin system RelE/ParE family toxin [Thiomicrospira sp.]|uniref:type II toxin-antitoxin system RelE family toxin n=1 Tax=Thiomicrospira sp. TaxID=935 RepID=UPI001A061308|nr:type II toxin-antitoxin system RelE/ParE family toxin [Thiomicrospira sp.]MBE0493643.1 type II toxin-antitoxin system RelE/ParE family toxin [Thiomicrospira sp.]
MQIKWQPKASKQLKKLKDKQVIGRIVQAVAGLDGFPDVTNVKTLVNHDYSYRLRVGDYRVFFNVHEVVEIISIEEVRKRDERTY